MRYIVIAALLLAGCKTTDAIKVNTVTVEKVVTATCVKKADIPDEPASIADKLTKDARVNEPLLAASASRLRSWGKKLHGMLSGCAID